MSKYLIRENAVDGYQPANHVGTLNRRLVGPHTGARQVEIVLGEIQKGSGALPHAHPGIEQAGYMLTGRARMEIGLAGDLEVIELEPGDSYFLPPDTFHNFIVLSDEPVRVLVIYSPPYGERPENVSHPGSETPS